MEQHLLDLPEEPCLPADPVESAGIVGLHYVTDQQPGISREESESGFVYFYPDGKAVSEEKTLRRIKGLVIPPAWKEVWISPLPEGHLQATGRDARGRKQYRYHRLWGEVRGQTKFNRMILFGGALPAIRQRTDKDLTVRGLARERVLATVVRLLETSLIRIGNEEYARENSSFGLTTLRSDHIDVSGSVMRFHYRGKSGKSHNVKVDDRRLARVIRRCVDLPGQELFQYLDDEGTAGTIDSGDVNTYLFETTGEHFTAKDFRTWGGTMHAARILVEMGDFTTRAQAKRNIVQTIKRVAGILGNRAATCKKYYAHPAVLDCYVEGKLLEEFSKIHDGDGVEVEGLEPDETAVLRILSEWDAALIIEKASEAA